MNMWISHIWSFYGINELIYPGKMNKYIEFYIFEQWNEQINAKKIIIFFVNAHTDGTWKSISINKMKHRVEIWNKKLMNKVSNWEDVCINFNSISCLVIHQSSWILLVPKEMVPWIKYRFSCLKPSPKQSFSEFNKKSVDLRKYLHC